MTVLVTGGTGYVGLNLVHELAETYDVSVLVRASSRTRRLPDAVTEIEGDVTDEDTLRTAARDADAVVHLAAKLGGDPESIFEVNVEGTSNVLEVCAEQDVEKFVFTSTMRAHPDVREVEPIPDGFHYAKSKAEISDEIRASEFPFDTTVLYPTYLTGAFDYDLKRYLPFKKVHSNVLLVPPLYIPGKWNLVGMREVTEASIAAIEGELRGHHLVTGRTVSSVELYRLLAETVASRCHVVNTPYSFLRFGVVPALRALRKRNLLAVDESQFEDKRTVAVPPEQFEMRSPVRNVPLDEVLDDTCRWYEEVGLL